MFVFDGAPVDTVVDAVVAALDAPLDGDVDAVAAPVDADAAPVVAVAAAVVADAAPVEAAAVDTVAALVADGALFPLDEHAAANSTNPAPSPRRNVRVTFGMRRTVVKLDLAITRSWGT
jgi:hypothetical protein